MFAINAAARVARRLLPTHDVATAYDEPHLPRFIDDKRPGGCGARRAWGSDRGGSLQQRAARAPPAPR